MKVTLKRGDKIRLAVSTLGIALGLLCMISIDISHRNNPPPDADIGGAIIYGSGLIMSVVNGIFLLAVLIYLMVRGKFRSAWRARAVTVYVVCLVVAAVGAGWYFLYGSGSPQNSGYNKELHNRYGMFIEYSEPVELKQVIGRQSNTVSTDTSVSPAVAIANFHDCSAGTSIVNDTVGITYFAFSGVQKATNGPRGSSDCVFYIGRETHGQAWNGVFNDKCVWHVRDTLSDNVQRYPIQSDGLHLDELLSHCQDLRTGRAPADL